MTILEKKLFKKFRNLSQYSHLSDKEITDLVNKKLSSIDDYDIEDDDLNVNDLFFSTKERKEGNKLLKKYLHDFAIENVSDKNILSQLIFLEIFNKRLQQTLNRIEKEGDVPSIKLIDSLHRNLSQIVLLKNSLGLIKDNKSNKTDDYSTLEKMRKKFKVWINHNQASRTLVCPNCSKMVLLKIRTDVWEAQKHPFFKDRILGNDALIKYYKSGKLGKKEVAEILECSSDYVDWLIEKWNKIPPDPNKETIQIVIPMEKDGGNGKHKENE